MEFESKIASFASSIFLLGAYAMLFDFWGYSSYMVGLSTILLLFISFRDHQPQKNDLINIFVGVLLSLFFYKEIVNNLYVSLVVITLFCLIAFNARPQAILPSLAGLITLYFINPELMMRGFNSIFLNLSSLFGMSYAINDLNYLIPYQIRENYPIYLDYIKVDLLLYISIFVSQVVLLLILNIDRKRAVKFAVLYGGITLLFSIFTLKNLIQNQMVDFFVPSDIKYQLLPLVCILLISSITPSARIRDFKIGGLMTLRKLSLPLLVAFFFLAVLYYTPITTSGNPLLIIDESHSEWEPTWPDYVNTSEKSPISGDNNYFGLLNVLSGFYDITLMIDRPEKVPYISSVRTSLVKEISLRDLENISKGRNSVLVLKCVTRPYSDSESEAIMEFISKGNGLILIGEHTDMYGMAANINPVAEKVGYRFLPNAVQDAYSDFRETITQRGEFPSLIARYMTGDLEWATSTTLEKVHNDNSPLFEIVTRPSYFSTYRNETSEFFLTRTFTEEVKLNGEFAKFLVIAGSKYGNGRVILFTDSTQFNNAEINAGNHLQMFLGFIEYAASIETLNKTYILFLLLAVALLLLALNRRNALGIILLMIILILISFSISYSLAHYTTPFPVLKTEPRIVSLYVDEDMPYLPELMDVAVFSQNTLKKHFTPLIITEPSEEWFNVSRKIYNLTEITNPNYS